MESLIYSIGQYLWCNRSHLGQFKHTIIEYLHLTDKIDINNIKSRVNSKIY